MKEQLCLPGRCRDKVSSSVLSGLDWGTCRLFPGAVAVLSGCRWMSDGWLWSRWWGVITSCSPSHFNTECSSVYIDPKRNDQLGLVRFLFLDKRTLDWTAAVAETKYWDKVLRQSTAIKYCNWAKRFIFSSNRNHWRPEANCTPESLKYLKPLLAAFVSSHREAALPMTANWVALKNDNK